MTHPGQEAEDGPKAEDQQSGEPSGAEHDCQAKLRALEAVLFMAAVPLPAEDLAGILAVTPHEADELARQLEARYADAGLQVTRVAGGYQVSTRPEYGHYVAKLHEPERFRLSRAALETLAIVAYRQPVTRPEVDAIRGVNSDSPLDTLLQYELISEAGRKDTPGRPLLYRTTDSFLGKFGLNSISDLPQLDALPVAEQVSSAEPEAPDREGEAREESPPAAEQEPSAA
jgi:segregation and condensation protein B